MWLLLKRKVRRSWKEFAHALTAFFNHYCLPLQCPHPFPKPGSCFWCTIMAKYSISFQQALSIVLLLMMLFIYQNHRRYDITLIQWAWQETFKKCNAFTLMSLIRWLRPGKTPSWIITFSLPIISTTPLRACSILLLSCFKHVWCLLNTILKGKGNQPVLTSRRGGEDHPKWKGQNEPF